MKEYTVYMHISPSNKRYIGITSQSIKIRWQNGKGYRKNIYITRAIEKYGWDNFQHLIVAKGLTERDAKWLEIELIKVWNSSNREYGYNISLGGESWNCSEETRKKISENNKGKHKMSEEHKQKISKIHKGKIVTEESRKKMSESRKGKLKGENNPFYGKHHTEESRKKMSENVICITTNTVFNSIKEGAEYYNIKSNHISCCCRGERKSCGKYNGQKLVWRYLEIIPL